MARPSPGHHYRYEFVGQKYQSDRASRLLNLRRHYAGTGQRYGRRKQHAMNLPTPPSDARASCREDDVAFAVLAGVYGRWRAGFTARDGGTTHALGPNSRFSAGSRSTQGQARPGARGDALAVALFWNGLFGPCERSDPVLSRRTWRCVSDGVHDSFVAIGLDFCGLVMSSHCSPRAGDTETLAASARRKAT